MKPGIKQYLFEGAAQRGNGGKIVAHTDDISRRLNNETTVVS